jgi:hypothetical protein
VDVGDLAVRVSCGDALSEGLQVEPVVHHDGVYGLRSRRRDVPHWAMCHIGCCHTNP